MGWRGQDNRDRDEKAARRSLPLRERYAWRRIAVTLLIGLILPERDRSGRVVSFDRVIACCRIGSTSIGDLLRQEGLAEGESDAVVSRGRCARIRAHMLRGPGRTA